MHCRRRNTHRADVTRRALKRKVTPPIHAIREGGARHDMVFHVMSTPSTAPSTALRAWLGAGAASTLPGTHPLPAVAQGGISDDTPTHTHVMPNAAPAAPVQSRPPHRGVRNPQRPIMAIQQSFLASLVQVLACLATRWATLGMPWINAVIPAPSRQDAMNRHCTGNISVTTWC